MRAVAAVPAVGLLAGTGCGLLLSHPPVVTAYIVLSLAAGLAVWAWRVGRTLTLVLGVATAFFAGGAILAADAWQHAWRPPLRDVFDQVARDQRADAVAEGRVAPEEDEAAITVTGRLRTDASPGASGVTLSLEVDSVEGEVPAFREGAAEKGTRPLSGGILVTVVGTIARDRLGDWRAGRRLRMPVQLRRPSRYLDPGVPDAERALARRGTALVGTVKSGALVDVVSRGSWFAERAAAARAFARRSIGSGVGRWSPRSAAIVTAIVIGDRAGLDDDVQRRLQEAGTYHVIAISGGNIAILAGLMLGAYRIAGLLGRGAMLSSIATLLAYAYFVGGGASVDRATLMAVVAFAGRAVDQRSPALNTLAVTASVLVAADPLSVADPSFVLTFGATLAILVAVPVASGPRLGRLAGPLAAMFVASVAAEAMLFPVSALVFSRVTFAGLALNFLAIPLMAIAQVAGMIVVPAAAASEHAAALAGFAAHLGAAGLVRSADFLQLASLLSYRIAPPNTAVVAAYYLALAVSWIFWRRRHVVTGSAEAPAARWCRWTGPPVALTAAFWILAEPWAIAAAGGDGRLHVTFVDVGQGDGAVVRFPRGSTMVVDTGGVSTSSSFDIGDRVVAPVLREAGVRRLRAVVLTHGDPDHIGGAASVLGEFRPAEVWEGIPVPRFEPLNRLKRQAQSLGSRWANVYAGDRVVLDGVEVIARHPVTADWERQRVRNDDSIVLELRWRDASILFTGDIGKAVEPALSRNIPPARLRVVKVPHHGSLTSSTPEFLRAIRPQIAVVSAGRGNRYGHPVPVVLQRYRDAGAEIFRTDRDGAVTVDTDGTSLDVRTFTGRRFRVPPPSR